MRDDETCDLLCLDAARAMALRDGLPAFDELERAAEGARAL